MTRTRLALAALVALFTLVFGSFATVAAQAPTTGILNAHGGAKNWNQGVADAAAEVDREQPMWASVRGRSATDSVIDRYSSPGASGLVSVSYGW
jgi:uncharacterized protein YfaP (DUF2135 family)